MDDLSRQEHARSTAELLALALTNRHNRARVYRKMQQLLRDFGVPWLRNASIDELRELAGLTQRQAEQLYAITTLTTRLAQLETGNRRRIETDLDAALLLYPLLAHLDHEEFRVLVLDSKNHVLANLLLYKGTTNDVPISPSEVFRQAIVRNSHRIIVAHNHPSLDPEPSLNDIELTQGLIEAGETLDIELVDHIIVGGHPFHYTSMTAFLAAQQSHNDNSE